MRRIERVASVVTVVVLSACASHSPELSRAPDSSTSSSVAACSLSEAQQALNTALDYRQRGYYKDAVFYYQQAAEQCNQRAQFELAEIYQQGWGVDTDVDKALSFYQMAAAQGNVTAMTQVGVLLDQGQSQQGKDYPQAMRWFRLAAEKQDALAQYYVAEYYWFGHTGKVDIGKANDWFKRSALNGNKDAAFNLAYRSYRGSGLPRNMQQTYKWLSLAAALDYYDAANLRDSVGSAISLEQRMAVWKEVGEIIKDLEQAKE